jgi:hypothetical protein
MSRKRSTGSLFAWERAMFAAWRDRRYHETLDPLYDRFQEWRRGELDHTDLDAAIHCAHRELQKVYAELGSKPSELARTIVADRAWYDQWCAGHPPPDEDES